MFNRSCNTEGNTRNASDGPVKKRQTGVFANGRMRIRNLLDLY